MKIKELLDEACIAPELKATNKDDVISELATLLAHNHPEIEPDKLIHTLLDREKLGSTGIGHGVAIPHGKFPNLNRMLVGFGRSAKGVSFDAQDSKAVHIFFVLVAPENATSLHLKALARLSRLLKEDSFRSRLLHCQTSKEIYNTIVTEDEKF